MFHVKHPALPALPQMLPEEIQSAGVGRAGIRRMEMLAAVAGEGVIAARV